MPTTVGSVRRLLLAPSLTAVSFAGRDFPVTPTAATRALERIPQAVVCGFEWGIDTREPWELERRLEMVEPELRGFAYEGATMACTVLDATAGGHRTRDLLTGPGRPHVFLTYIGIGFAMARLPRPLWHRVLPDLTGAPFHPTMSWLAVDGYGFDLAYFHTRRWVAEQRVPAPYPWQGDRDYFPRAVDQGIGRALWFIHGGDPVAVVGAVDRFAPDRRADLFSGVGLAATFAGGGAPDGLARLAETAGPDRPQVALGAVFAAKARAFAGFVPAHTEEALRALAGLALPAAVALADETEPEAADTAGSGPRYERWRQNIRTALS